MARAPSCISYFGGGDVDLIWEHVCVCVYGVCTGHYMCVCGVCVGHCVCVCV